MSSKFYPSSKTDKNLFMTELSSGLKKGQPIIYIETLIRNFDRNFFYVISLIGDVMGTVRY